jgi:endonuclease G
MTADLSKKATLEAMTRLGNRSVFDSGDVVLEPPGTEPTTPPDDLADREGFDADFLDGWQISLPEGIGSRAGDMRQLRRGGTGTELKYKHFSVIMSASRRLPMLTAVNINGEEARRVPRIQTWSFDGRLNPDDQWGNEIYNNNALDRGHMVRREDPNWGTIQEAKTANVDTFHFTNSCPQMAGVNQRTWLGLENYVLLNAKADKMRVSVFTGPFFSDDDIEYRGALIPAAFWKVVAIVTDDGRPSATAYKVSQVQQLADLEFVYGSYQTFQISVRQVMEQAEIDFSELVDYDGFSQHEAVTGQPLEERLDSLEMIRV